MLAWLTVSAGVKQAIGLWGADQQAFVQRGLDHGVGRVITEPEPPEQAVTAQLAVSVAIGQARQAFVQVLSAVTHMLEKTVIEHAIGPARPADAIKALP